LELELKCVASDDEIFVFSIWFVVQSTDDNIPLNSLSAFALGQMHG